MGSSKTESYFLLFADDLTTSFFYDKIRIVDENISSRINEYLKKIVMWLSKWRLKMSQAKCSYTVYTKGYILSQ